MLVPLALLAFQSSGQVATSRVLRYPEYTGVALTSIYYERFGEPDILSLEVTGRTKETRQIEAVICLLLGTVLGGLWALTSVGLMGALWTAAMLKAVIVLILIVWKADKVY